MNTISIWWRVMLLFIVFTSCQPAKTTEKEAPATEVTDTVSVDPMSEDSDSFANVLNANLATEEELTSAGMNASLAQQVVASRPFTSMVALDQLFTTSIDSAARVELYRKVFVPMNLNTTREEDFKIIPGVGNRMAHEFEEYRPYRSIKQFRQEIGKYVDENELARLEQYVFVPVELNTATKEEIMAIPGVGERMHHEFEEYRPYVSMEQFRKEIGKYVDDKELARLERYVYLKQQ